MYENLIGELYQLNLKRPNVTTERGVAIVNAFKTPGFDANGSCVYTDSRQMWEYGLTCLDDKDTVLYLPHDTRVMLLAIDRTNNKLKLLTFKQGMVTIVIEQFEMFERIELSDKL